MSRFLSWLRAPGLRLALGTLTIIPVGEVGTPSRRDARWAMSLAWLAAVPIAIAAALVMAASEVAALPPLATGALVVGAMALATRAMHLDGLADTVDGLGAGWQRDRALQVMRQGDVGPMGVVAVLVAVLLQVSAVATLASVEGGWLLVAAAVMVSRGALVQACRSGMPSARLSGLGAVMAGSIPLWLVGAVGVGMALLATVATLTVGLKSGAGVVAVVLAVVAVQWLLHRCVRVLGGVTGDVMGATIEIAFTVLLLVFASGRW